MLMLMLFLFLLMLHGQQCRDSIVLYIVSVIVVAFVVILFTVCATFKRNGFWCVMLLRLRLRLQMFFGLNAK